MFDSKFTVFIISVLILCLILAGYYIISDNTSDFDSNTYEDSNDSVMMPILDENESAHLVPTTQSHAEGQATS